MSVIDHSNRVQNISDDNSIGRACFLSVLLFLVMCAHYLFKAGTGAVLIKTFGAMKMPWFDVADALLSLLAAAAIFRVRALRLRLSACILGAGLVLAVGLAVFGLWVHPDPGNRPQQFMVGLAGSLLVSTGTYGVWMLLASTAFRRGWATLTIVGLGAQAGVIAGSSLARALAGPQWAAWLPAMTGALYCVVFLAMAHAMRRFSCGGTALKALQREGGAMWRETALSLSPYVVMVFLLLLAGSCFGRSVDWRIKQEAGFLATVKGAAGFLATFYASTGWLSLLCQLLITPLALRLAPARWGLVYQPLLGVALASTVLAGSGAAAYVIGIALYTSLDYTVYNGFKERLWLNVPLETKVSHKAIAALVMPKAAAVLSALGILGLAAHSQAVWAGAVALLACAWAALAWRLGNLNARIETVPPEDFRSGVDKVRQALPGEADDPLPASSSAA